MLLHLLAVFSLLGKFLIFHLNFHFQRVKAQSFVPGSASSLGVLPTSLFSTTNSQNIPISGLVDAVGVDCGWTIAAAGSTAPGYFTVPVFGVFNVGTGNVGSANVGSGNVGYGNYGTGNIGRLNTGTGNVGYLNGGVSNAGYSNTGNGNVGDGNSQLLGAQAPAFGYNNGQAEAVIGANNAGSFLIGSQLTGSYLIGTQQQGSQLIGYNNTGSLATGVSNYESQADSIGVLNAQGSAVVGQGNVGSFLIGFNNQGTGIVGYNSSGSLVTGFLAAGFNLTGFNVTGTDVIGADSSSLNVIGYNNSGINIVGVDYDINDVVGRNGEYDDPVIPSYAVNFALPTSTLSTVATTYNSLPVTESASSTGAFITSITTQYKFNVDEPALLTVVDLGCAGDSINVYDWGALLFTTTAPSTTSIDCAQLSLSDPDAALAEFSYSRGYSTLSPGLHVLSFAMASGGAGSALAFRVDSLGQGVACAANQCPGPVPFLNTASRAPLVPNPPPWILPKRVIVAADSLIDGTVDATVDGMRSSSNYQLPSIPVNVTNTTQPCNCTCPLVSAVPSPSPSQQVVSLNDPPIADFDTLSSTPAPPPNEESYSVTTTKTKKKKFKVKRVGRRLSVITGAEVDWRGAGQVCARLGGRLAIPDEEGDRVALQGYSGWIGGDWRGSGRGGACLLLSSNGKISIATDCKSKLSGVICKVNKD